MATTRSDVASGHAVYSCNCGFIDRSHATPQIARDLWRRIATEADYRSPVPTHRIHTINNHPGFVVYYQQGMQHPAHSRIRISEGGYYLIRRHLSLEERKRIALRIFMDISLRFENAQRLPIVHSVAGSGFSAEDLMSDLIGFFMAVDRLSWATVEEACLVRSPAESLEVWDANVAPGGLADRPMMVTRFYEPRLFPCASCPQPLPPFPQVLKTIVPAVLPYGNSVRFPDRFARLESNLVGQSIDFASDGRAMARTVNGIRLNVGG